MSALNLTKLISLYLAFFCASLWAGSMPKSAAMQPEQVVVVVNKQDANSVAVGDYYLNARNIPKKKLNHCGYPVKYAHTFC